MKKYFYVLPFFLAFLCCPLMTSCGDDDEEEQGGGDEPVETSIVNPSKVFTAGLPKSVGGNEFTTDEKGRVIKMAREGYTITFDYSALTRASKADVVMTIEYDGGRMVCDLTLNDQGYVSFCDENSHDDLDGDEHQTWKFSYDTKGHLIKMVRSEGGNETTYITYHNGDITEVETISEDDPDDGSHYTFSYEMYVNGEEEPRFVDNVGGVMFFDEAFGIDMDEMIHAYWAGMLGQPTKHLPSGRDDVDDQSGVGFSWRWDEEGFPTRFFPDANEKVNYLIVW